MAAARPIVVASKIDTEGALLGNMIADGAAGAAASPVERKMQLGPTNIVRAALLAGQIDIYPEYTGNGALFFHRESDPVWKNAAQRLRRGEDARREAEPSRLADPGAGQQHLGHRDPRRSARVSGAANASTTWRRTWPSGGRFKLAASAEFVESPAALPAFETDLRVSPAARTSS